MVLLGVNIDHVATVRQARGTQYPDIWSAAQAAIAGGADGITVHLREDRRHIQDDDVLKLKAEAELRLNLEMALTDEMEEFASQVKPTFVCLVPEKREELTTEGGLDLLAPGLLERLTAANQRFAALGIQVSLFIDADPQQIAAAHASGAPLIELHTGAYAEATATEREQHLQQLFAAAEQAHELGLIVNAGHGLNYDNLTPILAMPHLHELNIGHAIVARALLVGMEQAVREMKQLVSGKT